MFTVYLIKVVWETLAFALALIKCCWVAKCLEKLFYERMAGLLNLSASVPNQTNQILVS